MLDGFSERSITDCAGDRYVYQDAPSMHPCRLGRSNPAVLTVLVNMFVPCTELSHMAPGVAEIGTPICEIGGMRALMRRVSKRT